MVLSRTKTSKKIKDSYTIDELFKKEQSRQPIQEDDDELQLAIQLSKEEHVNEQRRLLEQFSQLSQRMAVDEHVKTSTSKRVVTSIIDDDDDDDEWFQTISNRPQPKYISKQEKKKKRRLTKKGHQKEKTKEIDAIVKKEEEEKEENMIIFDIENVSDWLQVKEEDSKEEEEESLIIDDLTSFLNEEEEDKVKEDSKNESIVSLNSDSEYSLIDLVNDPPLEGESKNDANADDGCLSPLEGFINIKENRDKNEEFNPYFEQLQTKTKRKRSTKTKTTEKSKKYKKRWFRRKRKT
ncbi:uncharacterized protein BX663DRAFT_547459 [Cokeromyces recurvatus]|uniref:uncharacterized protein n=1 Tax=Cokeromyces recurvatus TaxID=90255 RepID=UPI002220E164|nr:uncharacterized protein BX663DRAFT_547459 [Cokeromyces recurvatus]KAI7907784.1 hypothetical protein BX663DRAFT_547459 [Cokeromyces recurvatus]